MKREVPRDEFVRKRQERQKKIRKRRIKAFFILFILTALCVGAVLCLTVFFPIEKVVIKGSKIYSVEEIFENSNIESGDNLFLVSRNKTEERLKSKLPYIDSVTFKRELPETLNITVKDATEFAVYEVKEQYYTVSESGWVMKKSGEKPENLICIKGNEINCKVGSQIVYNDSSQKELIETISQSLKDAKINADLIDTTGKINITLGVEGRFTVNLGNSNFIEEKIKHLAGMIKEMPEENKGKIDLSMWTNDNSRGSFRPENG